MPKEFGRNRRIAELIKHELAGALQQRFPTSQYGLITLSAVDVSPDLENARVYVTCLKEDGDIPVFIKALNAQTYFFRTRIARVMHSRKVPAIQFQYDESIRRSERLTALLDSLAPPKTD